MARWAVDVIFVVVVHALFSIHVSAFFVLFSLGIVGDR